MVLIEVGQAVVHVNRWMKVLWNVEGHRTDLGVHSVGVGPILSLSRSLLPLRGHIVDARCRASAFECRRDGAAGDVDKGRAIWSL